MLFSTHSYLVSDMARGCPLVLV